MLTDLTSEVKSGQSSCGRICQKECTKKVSGYVLQLPSYGHLKFSIWPQRSNLTSEVENHLDKKLRIGLKDFT